jgi:hypothetical protein
MRAKARIAAILRSEPDFVTALEKVAAEFPTIRPHDLAAIYDTIAEEARIDAADLQSEAAAMHTIADVIRRTEVMAERRGMNTVQAIAFLAAQLAAGNEEAGALLEGLHAAQVMLGGTEA